MGLVEVWGVCFWMGKLGGLAGGRLGCRGGWGDKPTVQIEIGYWWIVPSGMVAPFRLTPARSAPSRFAFNKFALNSVASVKIAPDRSASSRLALKKFAPLRFAPFRFAPDRSA